MRPPTSCLIIENNLSRKNGIDASGRAAVFVTGEPAWHKLGTVIEQVMTSAEAIGLAGLDWRVEQWPVRAFDPDSHATEAAISGTVANGRTDTRAVMGVVGRRYRVFQNHEGFDSIDSLVGDKLAMYEVAGSLHGGKRVWIMAGIPKEYRAGPDDLIKPSVLLTNTHDGSQTVRMIPTTVRVVCQNRLYLALREAGVDGLSIYHHPNLETLDGEERTLIETAESRYDEPTKAVITKFLLLDPDGRVRPEHRVPRNRLGASDNVCRHPGNDPTDALQPSTSDDLNDDHRLLTRSTCRNSTRSDSWERHSVAQVTIRRSLKSWSVVTSRMD